METAKILIEAGAHIDDKDRDNVLTLINGPALPLPEAQPPFPEFAKKHDLSIVIEVTKDSMGLQISADRCIINWGDDSDENVYDNIKEKNIRHRYRSAGSYTITVNATGLSYFSCTDNAKATAIYLNNCPQLKRLYCFWNELTSLDISRCTALETLSCSHNKLTSLDLSNNLALDYLYCDKNLLTCLDISNNTKLTHVDCSENRLSILNVNPNSAIMRLTCNNNQLSKHVLNRIFNQLPNYISSGGTVDTWYGQVTTDNVFIACGHNSGFNSCNKIIPKNKNWCVWIKAMYISATLAGTPGHWQEDYRE
jgi:Leucine-rich repeat (LRR) protein